MSHHGTALPFRDLVKVRIVYSNQSYTLHDSVHHLDHELQLYVLLYQQHEQLSYKQLIPLEHLLHLVDLDVLLGLHLSLIHI